jgi:hypothetical protein
VCYKSHCLRFDTASNFTDGCSHSSNINTNYTYNKNLLTKRKRKSVVWLKLLLGSSALAKEAQRAAMGEKGRYFYSVMPVVQMCIAI